MSVGGCYTDFHIDFGGTSVWYHIMRGKKVRFFKLLYWKFAITALSEESDASRLAYIWIVHPPSLPPFPPFTHFLWHYVTGLGSIFAVRQSPVFVRYRESFFQRDECGFFFPNNRAASKLSIWGIPWKVHAHARSRGSRRLPEQPLVINEKESS